jgi:hypothetical protein
MYWCSPRLRWSPKPTNSPASPLPSLASGLLKPLSIPFLLLQLTK